MLVRRPTRPELRPFVRALWASDTGAATGSPMASRERVLPCGEMHVALRLTGTPFRFFDATPDSAGRDFGHAVVGGARATPYLKEVGTAAVSVGALLRPGAAAHVLGVSADQLADRHTRLDALWGAGTDEARERLFEAGSAERRLDVLETVLAARLPASRGPHPAVTHALRRFATGTPVGEAVRETGYSHRYFIALFRSATGIGPKRFSRIVRFGRALERLAGDRAASPSRVAFESGYSDQAHLVREFRAHTGLTPGEYLGRAGPRPYHLPDPATGR